MRTLPTLSAPRRFALRQAWKRISSGMRAADGVLTTLQRARGGGPLDRALAVAAIAERTIGALLPDQPVEEVLEQMGYKRLRTQMGPFLCDLVTDHAPPDRTIVIDEHTRIGFWRDTVAVVYRKGDMAKPEGPFLRGAFDMGRALGPVVWRDSTERAITIEKDGTWQIGPLSDLEPYFDEPSPEWLAHRIRKRGMERCSIVLVGETGSGKSALARHTARLLVDGGARTLLISGAIVRSAGWHDVLQLVRWLGPQVLVLDDVPLEHGGRRMDRPYLHDEVSDPDRRWDHIAFYEALRQESILVFSTVMEPVYPVQENTKRRRGVRWSKCASDRDGEGDLYYFGIRPGRVDEIVEIPHPGPNKRKKILAHHLGEEPPELDDMVEATLGFTPAYLRELAKRIRVYGREGWVAETRNLRRQLPPSNHILEGEKRRMARVNAELARKRKRRDEALLREKQAKDLAAAGLAPAEAGASATPEAPPVPAPSRRARAPRAATSPHEHRLASARRRKLGKQGIDTLPTEFGG